MTGGQHGACACRAGPDTSLVFCTNGILLRMLTQPQGLDRVTHLVMDEVHERDCFADFLLIVLKQACPVASLQHLQAQTSCSACGWDSEGWCKCSLHKSAATACSSVACFRLVRALSVQAQGRNTAMSLICMMGSLLS